MKLPARVKTLLCARLLTNGIGYKEEEEEVKKRTRLQFQHPNYVCFDAYKAKYVHTAINDF